MIYEKLVNSSTVLDLVNFQKNLMLPLFVTLLIIMLKNISNRILIFQVLIIVLSSIFLTPIYYFISYFCFFHSIKNFKETIYELEENKNRIVYFLVINTFLSIVLGVVLFFFFLDGSNTKKFLNIAFVGLAALTVPHMLLKAFISYKKKKNLLL